MTPTPLDRLADLLGTAARRHAPLGALTTYRVGGTADVAVTVDSLGDLDMLRRALAASGAMAAVPVLVVGKGSNILVADAGFRGVAVWLGPSFADVEIPAPTTPQGGAGGQAPGGPGAGERVVVRAGGAAGLPVVARRAVDAGLLGLEWAVGIPGSVGGALRTNAGGHGSDTASCLVAFTSYDLAGEAGALRWPADRLSLGYRTSSLGPTEVVLWAEFAATRGDPEEGRAALSEIVRWRREHQPGGSNAGSVFTNPPGDSAGRLVDAAGLKGLRVGSAHVSEKHANFIQADEGGSADDVARLIATVRDEVARVSGVVLRPEVALIGFDGPGADGPDGGVRR